MFVDQEFDVVGTKATIVGRDEKQVITFADRKEDVEEVAIKEELGSSFEMTLGLGVKIKKSRLLRKTTWTLVEK